MSKNGKKDSKVFKGFNDSDDKKIQTYTFSPETMMIISSRIEAKKQSYKGFEEDIVNILIGNNVVPKKNQKNHTHITQREVAILMAENIAFDYNEYVNNKGKNKNGFEPGLEANISFVSLKKNLRALDVKNDVIEDICSEITNYSLSEYKKITEEVMANELKVSEEGRRVF